MDPRGNSVSGSSTGYSIGGVIAQDEGVTIGAAPILNFTGAGVTATDVGGVVTVNIPGGGGGAPTTVLAGEPIAAGDVVAFDTASPTVRAVHARADVAARSRPQFVALGSASPGDQVQGVPLGIVDARTEDGLTDSDLGRMLYLSSMPGRATREPPSAPGTAVVEIGTIMAILAGDLARVLFRTQRIAVNL